MQIIRRLYEWVLSWSHSKFGSVALFFISFVESSFFPVPPDPLLLALTLGNKKKYLRYALICTLGSVLGGILGYCIGSFFWDFFKDFFFNYVPGFSAEKFKNMQIHYDNWSFWIVFISGFTPIPYKLFTITSGVFSIPLAGFIIASTFGRGLRFFIVAILAHIYGDKINKFINTYFNLLTIAFTILLVAGIYVSKFLLH